MQTEIQLNRIQNKFLRSVSKRFFFQFFLLVKLPAAWLAGLNVILLDVQKAIVSVKYKWLNQNPFQSIYFAVLAMAAELSTGLLCMMYTQDENLKISMLVVGVQASFFKKAVGVNRFVCDDGVKIFNAIEMAKKTREGVTLELKSTGYSAQNEIIAVFNFTWSFKVK